MTFTISRGSAANLYAELWGSSTPRKPKIAKILGKEIGSAAYNASGSHTPSDKVLDWFEYLNMELYTKAVGLASNPKHSRWVANALVAGEAALCAGILMKVPCKH